MTKKNLVMKIFMGLWAYAYGNAHVLINKHFKTWKCFTYSTSLLPNWQVIEEQDEVSNSGV